jgi:hypothetical protein
MCVQRAELGPRSVDRAVADLAARQFGVVAREQLRAAGLSDAAITRRVANGRLHRVHRGVFSVGHAVLGERGRLMAAVLAGGPGTVVSHASAAALWQLRRNPAVAIDITTRRTGRATVSGVRIHRPRTLRADEVTARHGIPVTTPARTLLDLAATVSARDLQRTLEEAIVARLASVSSLDAVASAHPGHHGARRLQRALATHAAGSTLTRSHLEERFLALCDKHALPRPSVNANVAGLEVDFAFADERVVVETDGWQFHGHRVAFERDRRRDATLTRAGYRALRFTHDQVAHEPHAVAATVAAALAA